MEVGRKVSFRVEDASNFLGYLRKNTEITIMKVTEV